VEISNCHIVCGDDAIVVKTSRRDQDYGDSFNISVRDCVLETQDSGVKIGTETSRDIRGISFERCEIVSSSRGCTIQLRDEGNVSDVLFRDIIFKSRYHSAPWWGRGEAISFTAFPRRPGTALGKISAVRVERVTGRAENSVRVSGCAESRISGVKFENVDITLSRWTHYPGREWDNRPTTVLPEIEAHDTPGIHLRYADDISLHRCRIRWGENCPDYFSHALEAHDVSGLAYPDFVGESAHPARISAISVR
jgi:polygalacturonase